MCIHIFMKENERRVGICLMCCGWPAVSLQDPSKVSPSQPPAFPGHRCSPWVMDNYRSGRRKEETIAVNMCYITRQCLFDDVSK